MSYNYKIQGHGKQIHKLVGLPKWMIELCTVILNLKVIKTFPF